MDKIPWKLENPMPKTMLSNTASAAILNLKIRIFVKSQSLSDSVYQIYHNWITFHWDMLT